MHGPSLTVLQQILKRCESNRPRPVIYAVQVGMHLYSMYVCVVWCFIYCSSEDVPVRSALAVEWLHWRSAFLHVIT